MLTRLSVLYVLLGISNLTFTVVVLIQLHVFLSTQRVITTQTQKVVDTQQSLAETIKTETRNSDLLSKEQDRQNSIIKDISKKTDQLTSKLAVQEDRIERQQTQSEKLNSDR